MSEESQTERDVAALRERAANGRRVSFETDFYALPECVQKALYGIAGELEAIADRLDGCT